MMHLSGIKLVLEILRTYRNWLTALKDHAGTIPIYKVVNYRLRNGIVMKTRAQTTDLGTMHTIFIGGENDRFLDNLRKRPVILDIGAHIGSFAVHANKKTENAKFFCIEPHPDNTAFLVSNLRVNKIDAVVLNYAAGAKKCRKNLYYNDRYTAGASLNSSAGKSSTTVDVMPLSWFIDKAGGDVDLVKLDCEGMDVEILEHLPKKYFNKIKFLHAEYHDRGELKRLLDVLESNGFSCEHRDFTRDYGYVYARRTENERLA